MDDEYYNHFKNLTLNSSSNNRNDGDGGGDDGDGDGDDLNRGNMIYSSSNNNKSTNSSSNNNCNDNCSYNNGTRTYRNSVFTENLCKNLNELRKQGKFCDWMLKTEDGCKISVHKNILVSTSTYFDGLLNSGMVECNQDYLLIKKISGKCLELIIEYIYTGEIQLNEYTVQEILENAMYFGLLSLIDICLKYLSEYVTIENSLQLWRYSETFSGQILKKKCVEHILEHGEEIFDNKFLTTPTTTPSPSRSPTSVSPSPLSSSPLFLYDQLTYDEMKTLIFYDKCGLLNRMILCPIIKWIMLDYNKRSQYIDKFLNSIQIMKLSDELYVSKILVDKNIKSDDKDFLSNMIEYLRDEMIKKNKKLSNENNGGNESSLPSVSSSTQLMGPLLTSELEDKQQLNSEIEDQEQLPTFSSHPEGAATVEASKRGILVADEHDNNDYKLFENEFIAICNCNKIWHQNRSSPSPSPSCKKNDDANVSDDRGSDNHNDEGIYLTKILEIKEFESHYALTRFLNNDILLCGGISLNEKGPCSLCKYYSTKYNMWFDLPSMKETRFMHSVINHSNKIYALGGFNNQTIEIFDINTINWVYGPSLKKREDNYDICTMLLNDNIYALGGRARSFQFLDIRIPNWIELPIALDVCMHPFSPSIAFNNFIYYLSNAKVKAFDIRNNNWLDTEYTYKNGKKLTQFRVLLLNNMKKIIIADNPLNLGTICIDINNIYNFSLSNFVTLSSNTNYCGLLSI